MGWMGRHEKPVFRHITPAPPGTTRPSHTFWHHVRGRWNANEAPSRIFTFASCQAMFQWKKKNRLHLRLIFFPCGFGQCPKAACGSIRLCTTCLLWIGPRIIVLPSPGSNWYTFVASLTAMFTLDRSYWTLVELMSGGPFWTLEAQNELETSCFVLEEVHTFELHQTGVPDMKRVRSWSSMFPPKDPGYNPEERVNGKPIHTRGFKEHIWTLFLPRTLFQLLCIDGTVEYPDSTVNLGDLSDGVVHQISYSTENSKINQTETRECPESYSTPEVCCNHKKWVWYKKIKLDGALYGSWLVEQVR
jgi:hypothetical protein